MGFQPSKAPPKPMDRKKPIRAKEPEYAVIVPAKTYADAEDVLKAVGGAGFVIQHKIVVSAEWRLHHGEQNIDSFECSNCGALSWTRQRHCPECGAVMERSNWITEKQNAQTR